MNCTFERLGPEHRDGVIGIFNYYIRETTAAYREETVAPEFFESFLETTKTYPGFAVVDEWNAVIGFCLLKPHKELTTFAEVAEIMYFIDRAHSGKGIGRLALAKLEDEGRKMGIRKILASISSENAHSLSFHRKNGFTECGRFSNIGKKFGRYFSIVWMGKEIG